MNAPADSPRPPSGLIDFCATMLPPEAGGPDPAVLANGVARYLAAMPCESQVALRGGIGACAAAGRLSCGVRLRDAPPEKRRHFLETVCSNGRVALAFDALKSVVCLVHGATADAEEISTWGRRFPPARPDAQLHVIDTPDWPAESVADAVVIGSGAGGAVAARTLARAGLDVVVLEEGRRWTVDEFRESAPIDRFTGLYRGAGTTLALGRPPVVVPIGIGVGGTTLVNSGTCYRPPEAVLRRWRDDGLTLADPDRLRVHLDSVETMLGVAPQPLDVIGRNATTMLAGAERLGWQAAPLRRNAPGCVGSCQCAIGCPRNAKGGVHLNALPDACAAGARIVTHARVVRVLHENGVATGVLARRPDGTAIRIQAPRVLVAAGAIFTPPLLRRSGLAGHRAVGRNLSVHPSLAVAGRFEEEIVPWHGVLQSAAVEEFRTSEHVLVEATATPPGMGSMSLPGYGAALVQRMSEADHNVSLGAMIGDTSRGRVLGLADPIMVYPLRRVDGRRLLRALEVMAELLFAAGAVEVMTGLHHLPATASMGELRAALPATDTGTLHLAAFHPVGTVAAGGDAGRFPCRPEGALRGTRGVWIADASLLPSCPEVNPQITVMATASAVASTIAEGDRT